MNSEIKQKWLEALRSGEYIQGKNHLAKEGQYCCLGVLCDLAVQEGILRPGEVDEDGIIVYQSAGSAVNDRSYSESSTLPRQVKEWAGLNHRNPYFREPDERGVRMSHFLSALNDNGSTFTEIADKIEEYF